MQGMQPAPRDAGHTWQTAQTWVHELRVDQVMLPRPYAVQVGTPLADVVTEMAQRRIGSVVVLDDEAVVGVVTTVDALAALAAILRGQPCSSAAAAGTRRA